MVKSAGKVMATVFWDASGIIYIDYLAKGQTINVDYASLLHRFSEEIKIKRPHLAKKKILFHQDNARVHTCAVLMGKVMKFKFELIQHHRIHEICPPVTFFNFLT
ncbi:hypothetical protein AVEN_129716-1 [Araneus ventricosus]|uniref:Mariner Mos1 transposase n=1 Tax=Araneus ventricosus TaxID=182803 RepID=A0A4Y2DI09_ARAVE|nr:hypothetical protein AVEN_129716-1 [Araneus ventricosus]